MRKRILLVEDEPLVAMETESELASLGLEVVGPAMNIEDAKRMIAESAFDAALVDANLGGRSAEEIAATLTRRGIPFAFATGYGREGLPERFRNAALLAKPFDANKLMEIVSDLLSRREGSSRVVSMRFR